MYNKNNNYLKYKIICIILYFIISLSGLSILFLFLPRKILLNENSENFKTQIFIFKDFAKSIHENINTSLIKNLTLTKENEECPLNFKPLIIKHQYYGNFSKFYGNRSICIERMDDINYSYRILLKKLEMNEYKNNIKECGELVQDSNKILYVPQEMICPLTYIEFLTKGQAKILSDIHYLIVDNVYLTPIYGNKNIRTPVIINIEIINNVKLCIERHMINKDASCEFPDNNQCYYRENAIDILYSTTTYNFYPSNLAKWNLINDANIEHHFCNKNTFFHLMVNGYINFTDSNLNQFDEEFPSNNFENNALYKTANIYRKYSKNIDRLFYLISFILLCFSILQFILQILLYFEIKIKIIYIINGIFLFIFKLLSYLGMLINHYYFYLKVEKVYIVLIDEFRNKILEDYSSTRKYFIMKIVILSIIGFIIVSVDYIILIFSIKLEWVNLIIKIKTKKHEIIIVNENNKQKIISHKEKSIKYNNIKDSECEDIKYNEDSDKQLNNLTDNPSDHKLNPFFQKQSRDLSTIQNNNDSSRSSRKIINLFNNLYEIKLKFVFKDNLKDIYEIKISKNKIFYNVIKMLKEKYPELKEKKMRIFLYGSNIISKNKTINDNGLSDDVKIVILP